MVPNRVDLASPNFDHADYYDAAGGRPPGANPLTWRMTRAFTCALERWSYGGGRAQVLDADSRGAKAALERRYPGLPVVVTPYRIDSQRFRPDRGVQGQVRAEEGAHEDDVVALFISRDWHVKGLELAIAGVAGARQRGRPVVLWVVGRDDPRTLGRLARRHGMEAHVRLLGFRSDVERLYAGADMLLLPTFYETFSRACHEAAAAEIPVVAPAVHGVEELIGDDEAGLAIALDVRSIADAVSRLAADPALRGRMGEAGRRRVLRFTLERSTDRWLDLYQGLASA
jgi:glycosyltransferase involved in cell wall biosynthesis